MPPIHPSILPLLDEEFLAFYREQGLDGPSIHEVPWDPACRVSTKPTPGEGQPLKVGSVQDIDLSNCRVRVFTPEGDRPSSGWPVIVYFHGGGWVLGKDIDGGPSERVLCTNLCQRASVVVVSVDYRLAPENPFPAAVEDAWDALRWTFDRGANVLGIDPTRICVGGASAGGNIAAALTHIAAQAEPPIPLQFQLLMVPVTDNRVTSTNPPYASWIERKHTFGPTDEQMLWFRRHYLPNEADWQNWKASPIAAPVESFEKVPYAWIGVAELDLLRDEGIAYGEKIRAAGVAAEVRRYPAVHALFYLDGALSAGKQLISDACEALHRATHT